MTQLLMKDAKFYFSDDCKKAFNILKEKLTTVPIIISPDWNEPFELMCDANDFAVGAEEITDEFPDEHLMILKEELNNDKPWYADYINYIVGKIIPPNWTPEKRRRFFSQAKYCFWDEPYAFKLCSDNVMRRYVVGNEIFEILAHCHSGPTRGHHSASITGRKVYESGFYWSSIFKDAKDYVMKLRGDKNFKAGDKVLIFNSRFKMHPGKLKSKWYSPCVVKTVHPYGTVEIIDKNGISFKVNGHRLKKYHDGYNIEEEKEVVELDDDTT
ncbi:reverse transcriptase domain-containing protein [Tanacetum coccineum]